MSNMAKLKELFFINARPVTSLTEPELALGEIGFHFGERVWVLKHPTTGEIIVPNRYEASMSIIAEKMENGVFIADAVGNMRFYKDLVDISPTLTTSNISMTQLHNSMVDNSIIFLQVGASSTLNGILPNNKGGIVKFSKFGDYILGDFSSNDGNRLLLKHAISETVKWKPTADFGIIERTGITSYIDASVHQNTIGSIGFIARGNTARKNLARNISFADNGLHWTINGGTITANTEEHVEITANGTLAAVVVTQEIDYTWLSYSHLISRVVVKGANLTNVTLHLNDSVNTKITKNNPVDWSTLEHDTTGLTFTTNTKVRVTMTFTYSSSAVANGKKFYISKKPGVTVNSIYATSLKLFNIKDYNQEINDRSSKLAIKAIGNNKFDKHKVTKGFKFVNGVVTADANCFISDYMTVGTGFNIYNATTIAWNGSDTSQTQIYGSTKNETNRNFASNGFRFSGLLSEIDKIVVTSQNVTYDSYERYSESIINIDLELRAINNSGSMYLHDEVYNITSDGYPDKLIHIKRISDPIAINTNSISMANGTGNQYVTIPLTQFPNLKAQSNGTIDNSFFISGIEREIATGITTSGAVFTFETTATNLIIAFPSNTFTSVADAALKLSSYILYHEINPIITELKLINTMVPSNCTIIQTNPIRSNLQYNLPINSGASFSDIYNKVEELSEALNNVGELGIGSGGSGGGPLSETSSLKLSAARFEFELPLQGYNPSTDLLLVYEGSKPLLKDRDYRIDASFTPMKIIKLDPITGGLASTPWPINTEFKFIAIISNGVSNRYIIPTRFESVFTVQEKTDKIPIQIPLFNPFDSDLLNVEQDNFNIHVDVNFTIKSGTIVHNNESYDGYYIELLDYEADLGSMFFFRVEKAFRSNDTFEQVDPTLIRKGITDAQLADSIRIGSIYDLTTNHKESIVGAINELVATKLSAGTIASHSNGVINGLSTSYHSLISHYDDRSNLQGVIKITLPFSWKNAHVLMSIRIKPIYNDNKIYRMDIGGFTNATTNSWENLGVFVDGAYNTPHVLFAHHNGKCCIFIGSPVDTVWSRPMLVVENLQVAANNIDNWSVGWTVEIMPGQEALNITGALTGTAFVEPVLGWSSLHQDVVDSEGTPLGLTPEATKLAAVLNDAASSGFNLPTTSIKTITVATDSWASSEGPRKFKAEVLVSDITKHTWVEVKADPDYYSIIAEAGISMEVDEFDGGFIIHSNNIPTEDINLKIKINV